MKTTALLLLSLLSLLSLLFAGNAMADTYDLPTGNWQTATGPYDTGMQFSGSFTTAAPLAANMSNVAIGPLGLDLATSWSFSDGIFTFTEANSAEWNNDALSFVVSTDSSGNLTYFFIILGSPASGVQIDDLVNGMLFFASPSGPNDIAYRVQAINQNMCEAVSNGVCGSAGNAPNYAIASAIESLPFVGVPIPVNSLWALAILALFMVAFAVLFRRRMV